MKNSVCAARILLSLVGILKTTITNNKRDKLWKGLSLLLAAFTLMFHCALSKSNGSGEPSNPVTTFTLMVTPPLNGSITVGAPVDVACNSSVLATVNDCSYQLAQGTEVSLMATADARYEFSSWGGDCSGSGICTLAIDGDKTASAVFLPVGTTTYSLIVMRPVSGDIEVSYPSFTATCSDGTGECPYLIAEGMEVTLTATADTGYEFSTWEADCPGMGSGNMCILTMDADKAANVVFTRVLRTLTIIPPIDGSIAVGAPVDRSCNSGDPASSCTYTMIPHGTEMTLTATADTGYEFSTWEADCPGMGSGNMCILTMDADKAANVVFTRFPRTLTVTRPANGNIAVGAPVNAACDSSVSAAVEDCTYPIADRTEVTLTATAGTGYIFISWSTCPGTENGNMCTFIMDADKMASVMLCDLNAAAIDCDGDGINNGDDAFPSCSIIDVTLDCDSDGINNGDDAFSSNADVQDAIALFSLGEQEGDFGFSACQTFLDNAVSAEAGTPRATDMYDRGFRTAKFYGSTPDYDFPNLHTDDDGLALTSAEVSLPVAVFMDDGTNSTHSFPVSSEEAKITMADLVAVNSGGAWTTANLFSNVLDPIIVNATQRFWTFTHNVSYSVTHNCSGATATASSGTRGNADAIDGVTGTMMLATICNNPLDVLCVAKR